MKTEISKYVGSKIKEYRTKKKLTQKELGKLVGVKHNTVSSYENGTNEPEQNILYSIAKALDVSINDFFPSDSANLVAEESGEYNVSKVISLPLFGDIAAGAVAQVEGVTEDDVEHIEIPKALLNAHQSNPNLFAMKVNGESMNRVIPDGSYVIAKPIEHAELKNDDIVIYSHDGEYSMKRYRIDEEDRVLVFSPESTSWKFRDMIIPFDTQNDLKIHGKIVLYVVSLD